MTDSPHVLLTNDDGIDSPALAALRRELDAVCDVTVVAPATDQSGVGRARSRTVDVEAHEWGYAVSGTPADCVAYGLRGLDSRPDLVVSGPNVGPNVGTYVLGRSGTVGAAVEAGFLGAPGFALSAYCPRKFFPDGDADYDIPARIGRYLVERFRDGDPLGAADFLNVNVPLGDPAPMRVARPFDDFDTDVVAAAGSAEPAADGGVDPAGDDATERTRVELADAFWARANAGTWAQAEAGYDLFGHLEQHREAYPEGTDRRTILDGEVAVSPLSVPQQDADDDAVGRLVADFNAGLDAADSEPGVDADATVPRP